MKTLIKNDFFIVFLLNNEKYACRLNTVSGILDDCKIKSTKNVPSSFLGKIKLQKESIPVIDMRKKLESKSTKSASGICIVLLIEGIDEKYKVGMLVDKIEEILQVPTDKVHSYSFLSGNINNYLSGNIESRDSEINIINMDAIFSLKDLNDIKNIKQLNFLQN